MKDFTAFLNQLHLPTEAQTELTLQMKRLASQKGDLALEKIAENFFSNKTRNVYQQSLKEAEKLGESFSIPHYTMDFLFLMTCGELLLEEYRTEGLSESLFWHTMSDLTCKAHECHTVYGIWGTFVAEWHYIFWTKHLFRLGRLEYECKELTPESKKSWNLPLEAGTLMHKIHIPSSGSLTCQEVLDSLRMAYNFFGYHSSEIAEFVCDSWILCPSNHQIFPEGSNLRAFFDLFTIYDFHPDEQFSDCWRIFGTNWQGDVSLLPQNTSLQRSIAAFLQSGQTLGEGLGILRFDGEHVLSGHFTP